MFNPGEFFEGLRTFYHPDTKPDDRMFKRPIVKPSFDVWDPDNKVLFSLKESLGKNKVNSGLLMWQMQLCVLHSI